MGTYGDFSDEALRETQKGFSLGHVRAAGYLLGVPQDVREAVEGEGTIYANVNGWRYADGVEYIVGVYLRGGDWQKYTRANAAMIKREQTTGIGTQVVTPDARVVKNREACAL